MKHLTFSFIIRLIIIALLGATLAKEIMSIFSARTEAGSLAAEAAIRDGTDSRTQSLRSLKQSESGDIARLDKAAVTKSKLADVISQIEDAGKLLGLSVTITSISDQSADGTVRIAIDTSGSWSGNFSMAHLLGSLPYKASVDEAHLTLIDKSWRGSYAITLAMIPE